MLKLFLVTNDSENIIEISFWLPVPGVVEEAVLISPRPVISKKMKYYNFEIYKG